MGVHSPNPGKKKRKKKKKVLSNSTTTKKVRGFRHGN